VGASINTFAVESMVDELAAAAGQDAFQFRRARLTDPRWIAVLEAAAALGSWGTKPPAGTARGIAIGTAFNSIVAAVVEVASSATSFSVRRVSVVLDATSPSIRPTSRRRSRAAWCTGSMRRVRQPDQQRCRAEAQLQCQPHDSAAGNAPGGGEHAAAGLGRRGVPIGGVGELGVPTLAPALANAVFATGQGCNLVLPDGHHGGL
jgi:isoquinoline 1-oxidoreductase beta subunit